MPSDQPVIIPDPAVIRHMQEALRHWHDRHGRHHLPWQQQRSPYKVWVSEIMLQQTQVSTVIPYFERFMQRYPDVYTLAASTLDEVLTYWQGLGYYRRARYLYLCAQTVATRHDGKFPENIAELTALPGIGRSTAGAILSMGMNQKASILDGNVKRILARCFMIPGWPGTPAVEKQLWQLTTALTPELASECSQHSQALMDLGATLCRRHAPQCTACPWFLHCRSRIHQCQTDYPERRPQKNTLFRERYLLWLCNTQGQILLTQRPPSGIWPGLWSLPEGENLDSLFLTPAMASIQQSWLEGRVSGEWLPVFNHAFTHFTGVYHTLRLTLPAVAMDQKISDTAGSRWLHRPDAEAMALPAPIRLLLANQWPVCGEAMSLS